MSIAEREQLSAMARALDGLRVSMEQGNTLGEIVDWWEEHGRPALEKWEDAGQTRKEGAA